MPRPKKSNTESKAAQDETAAIAAAAGIKRVAVKRATGPTTLDIAAELSTSAAYGTFRIWIVGTTPLIVHAWSQKAKQEMLGKQAKATKAGRAERDPESDFRASLYEIEPDVYGFPAMGVKNAFLSAAHKDKGIPRTEVLSALWIDADMVSVRPALAGAICDMPLLRIYGAAPQMREDMVRIGAGLQKKANLAYRAQFPIWAICVTGRLNTSVVTAGQLAALIQDAGTASGLGEWRNERKGVFGAFRLATVKEARLWDTYANGEGQLPIAADVDTTLDIAAEDQEVAA